MKKQMPMKKSTKDTTTGTTMAIITFDEIPPFPALITHEKRRKEGKLVTIIFENFD